jgi:malto-oligosyltrehalose trehalohydrolase
MALSANSKPHATFSPNFGPIILPDGGVLFHLYAPGAQEVDLCLIEKSTGKMILPMNQLENGWFGIHHKGSKAGDRYQFRIDADLLVPDPCSRLQAEDIHGASVIVDPLEYQWQDEKWQGRAWEDAVFYELHVGSFTPQGTFSGVTEKLDYLLELGITAVELMPLAQFPGRFNWGYDGALLFAPCNVYGTIEDLKRLIDTAHAKGLMVFLDVVYNHFGPDGNYLFVYANDTFFTNRFQTPWGAALNFSGKNSRIVRDFYIANALYWLEEFHFDGLRFDAVHAIFDSSQPDILEEIAQRVKNGPGRQRHIHLVLENDNNCARYLNREADGRPEFFGAQWNDDFHHACHTLLTAESEGYYQDYQDQPIRHLGRCLCEGFAYQGENSPYRGFQPRGEPSAHLPPLAFVSFLQNHDQIGNRAFGERLLTLCDNRELKILVALLLLAPSPPLLFMGEEFGAQTPFCFFCDFSGELAASVTMGRRKEFEKFPQFQKQESREQIPDPNAEATFLNSKLNWPKSEAKDQTLLPYYQQLLRLRHREIVPCLPKIAPGGAGFQVLAEKSLKAWWRVGEVEILSVAFNLREKRIKGVFNPIDQRFFQYPADKFDSGGQEDLPPKSIVWSLSQQGRGDV